jgi:hypothetical protein
MPDRKPKCDWLVSCFERRIRVILKDAIMLRSKNTTLGQAPAAAERGAGARSAQFAFRRIQSRELYQPTHDESTPGVRVRFRISLVQNNTPWK